MNHTALRSGQPDNRPTPGRRRNYGRLQTINATLRVVLLSLTVATTIGANQQLFAAEPVAKSRLGGVAIGGKDTVAYHALPAQPHKNAVPGKKAYTVKWKGAKWRFASAETAEKFRADPEQYAPAFNGHCANALSLGKGLLKTDGSHWEIFGNQLYLFYAAKGRDRWIGADDVQPYIAAAQQAWSSLK